MRRLHLPCACLLLFASLGLAACSAPGIQPRSSAAAQRCPELPGAASVLENLGKQFFIFGELHGTAETPALFGDFVCRAARVQPVVVGLELQVDQQPALDRYLQSDGSVAAQAEFRTAPHWSRGRDGRSSKAMFALVERLRVLRKAGLPIELAAFAPIGVTDRSSQTPYEKAMAGEWQKALVGKPQAKFVALVGNIHSKRRARATFEPAAMHMPSASIATFGYAPTGGEAWNCQQDGCGPHSAGPAITSLPRGISAPPVEVRARIDEDFWYAIGGPFTASLPLTAASARP